MLRDLTALEKGFLETAQKSREKCGDKFEKISQLIIDLILPTYKALGEFYLIDKKPQFSLVETCFVEMWRLSAHILFLSLNGLYRNAFDDIRYILESIVQALYIDRRHPETDIKTKIEILKEVEDKREYHAVRLIDELEIDHKDKLKVEYKRLSRIIHPSHKQVLATLRDVSEQKGVPVTIDCKEVSKIYESMKKMYDIFFFLFIAYFPEVKDALKKNPDFIKNIKDYKLRLLSKVLKVPL